MSKILYYFAGALGIKKQSRNVRAFEISSGENIEKSEEQDSTVRHKNLRGNIAEAEISRLNSAERKINHVKPSIDDSPNQAELKPHSPVHDCMEQVMNTYRDDKGSTIDSVCAVEDAFRAGAEEAANLKEDSVGFSVLWDFYCHGQMLFKNAECAGWQMRIEGLGIALFIELLCVTVHTIVYVVQLMDGRKYVIQIIKQERGAEQSGRAPVIVPLQKIF